MTFLNSLAKVSGKRPVWLYRIERGTSVHYLRRGMSDYVDLTPQTWMATAITHSRLPRTPRLAAAGVTLTLANSNAIAQAFLAPQGIVSNEVKIFQLFDDDVDKQAVLRFVGRVVGAKPSWTTIELACEAGISSIRQKALSRVIQRPCPWALYGAECGLTLADHQAAGTATAVVGSTVTVTGADAEADGFYSGGLIEFNGELQMITGHVGTALTLLGPVPGLAEEIAANTTAAVLIAPGCNLAPATCDTKFSNLENFGGFPWMTESPFDGRSVA